MIVRQATALKELPVRLCGYHQDWSQSRMGAAKNISELYLAADIFMAEINLPAKGWGSVGRALEAWAAGSGGWPGQPAAWPGTGGGSAETPRDLRLPRPPRLHLHLDLLARPVHELTIKSHHSRTETELSMEKTLILVHSMYGTMGGQA